MAFAIKEKRAQGHYIGYPATLWHPGFSVGTRSASFQECVELRDSLEEVCHNDFYSCTRYFWNDAFARSGIPKRL